MFDFEQEDTRDELELMEAQEQEEETEEVATDYREPAELIEELQAMPDDEGECTAKAATAEKLSLVSQWPSPLVAGSPFTD